MNELELLFEDYHHDCKPWAFAGKIPKHIKRCSVSEKEQMRLAKLGGKMMMAAYNAKTFYCQSMIAGAILDPKYDEIVVVTPSQYGKAIEKNVPVLTKNGWKKHGDLVVGDEVLSLDGNWVKVIYVHPDCEMDRKVTLENGDSFICHHNHEWVVKDGVYSTEHLETHWKRYEIPTSEKSSVAIASIEPISGYTGNCITVEGGIYRIGKHLIPTHNSWLMGRVALFRSYQGNKQYVTGAVANVTGIIMGEVIRGTQEAHPQIKAALMVKGDELARLAASLSKQRLAFASGGFVEAITLGDAYENNLTTNKAVGRAGDYIVDEAALVSDKSFVEMGRREFARVDGSKYKMIMISNPHRPGIFYDKLTEENPPKSRFILWIDALTAVEEERFDINTVFESDFAKNKSTMRRYLLCVLDTDGGGMFDTPKVYENHYETEGAQYFLGVDAAYKGKDNITVSLNVVGDGKFHIDEIFTMDKGKHWIDGVTSEDIIRTIARMARMTSAACVCVDVGWGVWLVEGLIRHGVHAIGVNFSRSPTKARISAKQYAATNAANKRAEMHLDLQCLMEDGVLEMSEDVYDKVKGTLPYVTSERKANGKIQIVPKEKIKAIIGHSPDELDSILLSVHAAIRFFGTASYAIP